MSAQDTSFVSQCREFLDGRWKRIVGILESGGPIDSLLPGDDSFRERVAACLNSSIKTYHYVLPTQLLCKCVNPRLDCHSIQAAYRKPGAFDARTIAHEVIVPFDQANHRVLGGSAEPYVNNPLRCPAVIKRYRNQQKNQQDWDHLTWVLDQIEDENSSEFTEKVFHLVLVEIYRRLSEVQVVYPVPNRVSLQQTMEIVSRFTAEKSGGDRIEAICTALFRTIGEAFGLFDKILRQKVNTADLVSGMGADIECWYQDQVALLVEVKDRSLTLTQLDAKLDIARSQKISEILFLVEQGIEPTEQQQTEERIKTEFVSGQNIYVTSFSDFSAGILMLLGEKGRIRFLECIGQELDRVNSSILHRRSWSQLLKSI
jgi:hypothetical protein